MSAAVAILIPLMRPHRLPDVLQSLAETTENYKVVVMATGECADAVRDRTDITLIEDNGGTYAQRINAGFRATTEPYVMLAADDVLFRPGWFDAAMRIMDTVNGLVAVNDMHNSAGTHFLVSRDYVDTLGGCVGEPGVVLHEGYAHSYCDDEIRGTAIAHGRFAHARDSYVEHMHPGAGKAPTDAIYQIGEASMSQGVAVLHSRSHLWLELTPPGA